MRTILNPENFKIIEKEVIKWQINNQIINSKILMQQILM
jgi:hypothetical protein